MANELIQPDKFFLSRFGMTESALEGTLGAALERKADYADLFFEYRSAEGLSLEDSIVNRTSKSLSHGVGVRVCAEDRTGYAYSDEVTVDRMRLAAEAARAIAHSGGDSPSAVQVGRAVPRHALYELESTPTRGAAGRARKAAQRSRSRRARVRSAGQERDGVVHSRAQNRDGGQ